MNIKTYTNLRIIKLRATREPAMLLKTALNITQKQDDVISFEDASNGVHRFILQADHGSVLEHASITVLIKNVSRSFLAQITRHRMASYTASSQHYQDYRDYPVIVHPDVVDNATVKAALSTTILDYIHMVDVDKVPAQEARQILPNASACNILWTINARSLVNFFQQRICRRNTDEMHAFAKEMHYVACGWWPELFKWVGPACTMTGKCNQGKMSCGVPYAAL